jgi:hypothetical protein
MHKISPQNAGNGILKALLFKIFRGGVDISPPPKFLSPYAYGYGRGLDGELFMRLI